MGAVTEMPKITGVILAGGRGSRMGGLDKGLIMLDGRPLIEHAIDALLPQVDELLISANRNTESYARYGSRVIQDSLPDYQGPLAGILAGLDAATNGLVQFLPCDVPGIPADLTRRLYQAYAATSAEICVPAAGGRDHPVCSLMQVSARDSLQDFLTAGGRKLMDWLACRQTTTVDFNEDPDAFANINTPEALQAFRSPDEA